MLSDSAWRLFVSMFVLCDDHGRTRGSDGWLDARVWAYRRDSPRTAAALGELLEAGLVALYVHRSDHYVWLPGWGKHQRIDNAGKDLYPSPDDDLSEMLKISPRLAAKLREPPRLAAGSEGKGREGKGEEEKKGPLSGPTNFENPPSNHGTGTENARSHASLPSEQSETVTAANTGETPKTPENASQSATAKARRVPKVKPEPPAEALTMALMLVELIGGNHPQSKIAAMSEADRVKLAGRWANSIRLLHESDGMAYGQIQAMIEWSQKHSFWRGVILSADNLRDKWDRMAAQRDQRRSDPRDSLPTAAGHVKSYGRYEPKTGADYSAPWEIEEREALAALKTKTGSEPS